LFVNLCSHRDSAISIKWRKQAINGEDRGSDGLNEYIGGKKGLERVLQRNNSGSAAQ
jgi:hypothetical protein